MGKGTSRIDKHFLSRTERREKDSGKLRGRCDDNIQMNKI